MYDYKDWESAYRLIDAHLWEMYRNCYVRMMSEKENGTDMEFKRWSVLTGKVQNVIDELYTIWNVVCDYKNNTNYMDSVYFDGEEAGKCADTISAPDGYYFEAQYLYSKNICGLHRAEKLHVILDGIKERYINGFMDGISSVSVRMVKGDTE